MAKSALKLGIAGLGTVGIGVIKMLQNHADVIAARAGRAVQISAISAKTQKKRGIPLQAYAWENDPVALAKREDIDVFVELIGGEAGTAKAAVEAALNAGKHVVTANKAMLAIHGHALATQAEQLDLTIRYEAAVAGGIPIVKALSEGLAGNKITRVLGIMNGTCNYILTKMQSDNLPYETVFAQANEMGYVEADPNLDIGGIDAAHKLSLLSALAFGTKVDFDNIKKEGIASVTIDDIHTAADMGFRIKLLGVAQMVDGVLEQRMTPCLVPGDSPLGQLEGGTNMVIVEGSDCGQIVLQGAGAGEGPTASAVLSDIIDIARGFRSPVFGQTADTLKNATPAQSSTPAPFYIRMQLLDQPGTLAVVASALGEAGVSIERIRQYRHTGETAPILIVTHQTQRTAIKDAINTLSKSDVLADTPVVLRIETL